jgi:S-adenosylmethionine hydrolase
VNAGPSAVFVGPDNGVLTPLIDSASKVYELTESNYFLDTPSATFHGRDVFAPAIAWIAKGTELSEMGREISDPHILNFSPPTVHENTITGEIVYIDRFGNLVSNVSEKLLRALKMESLTLHIGRQRIHGVTSHYSQCEPNEIGCLINSWGKLEVFCREGNAHSKLNCPVGTSLTIKKN